MVGIPFSGLALDRAEAIRNESAAIAELRRTGRLLQLDRLLPDLRGDKLSWGDSCDVPPEAELVFLGLDQGRGVFAAVPDEGNSDPAVGQRQIWQLLALLGSEELALYGVARSVLDWHARHRFCARCGHATSLARAGWQRDCGSCGAQHFPRVDPVAIMLVEGEGKLLLGRQARFPAGSYSALAGFVEPGESIEEAVAREVLEEAGVRVAEVRYIASQPWPFPSQLMLGCIAIAQGLELTIDRSELEDARWFTRGEVEEAMCRGAESSSFIAPTSRAISHHLLQWWLENRA